MIATLLYLPFGKFFHIFQRPAQIGVKLLPGVRRAAAGPALCARCGEPFASAMQIDDLRDGARPSSASTTASRAAAATGRPLCPRVQAQEPWRRAQLRLASATRRPHREPSPVPPDDLAETASARTSAYEPAGGWRGPSRATDRTPGQDPLLLLRPAVRHPAQGARRRGDRLRAVGGVPVQSRDALSRRASSATCRATIPIGCSRRLLRTSARLRARPPGRRRMSLTARRLREIQERHGRDAVAVYGGASLTTEKSYLLGKFARVALGTRHIDYNGRLCMVSAGTAYKMAFGVDRSPNPWADIPQAPQVVLVLGANVAECAPITTDYIWRCRDAGGKLIVVDPRMTPITRNADLYLPVRPGTDVGAADGRCCTSCCATSSRIATSSTRTRSGSTRSPSPCSACDPRHRGAHHRRAARGDREGRALVRRGGARDRPARARHRAPLERRRELPGRDQPGARLRATSAARARLHDDHRPGQRPGRTRARAEVRSAPRPALHLRSGRARARRARCWGIEPERHPAGRLQRRRDHGGDPPRRDQGARLDLLQPAGLAARRRVHARGAGEARVLRRDRLLPVRDRASRRRRPAPAACRKRTKA